MQKLKNDLMADKIVPCQYILIFGFYSVPVLLCVNMVNNKRILSNITYTYVHTVSTQYFDAFRIG